MKNEQGSLLPIVLVGSLFLCFFFTVSIAELKRADRSEQLYFEMVEAQYAAESGIAYTKQAISQQNDPNLTLEKQFGPIRVITQAKEIDPGKVAITATAYARQNVKQTITVHVQKEQSQ
jgi:hypothetical protein